MDRKEIERLPVMGLEVTEVRIYPFDIRDAGKNVRAVAEIVINGVLRIRDIKIIESNGGLFISMPSKRTRHGEFVPLIEPESKSLLAHIRRKVLDAYVSAMQRYFGGEV